MARNRSADERQHMTLLAMVRCAEREERLRREFYPRRVERGQMTQETADHEIACMAQIASSLRMQLVRETKQVKYGEAPKNLGT